MIKKILVLMTFFTSIFSLPAIATENDNLSDPINVRFKPYGSKDLDIQVEIYPHSTTLAQLGKICLDELNKIYYMEIIPNPYINRSQIEATDLKFIISGKSYSLCTFANPTPLNQPLTDIESIAAIIKGQKEINVYYSLQVFGKNHKCKIKNFHRIIDSPSLTLDNYCYTLCVGDSVYGYGNSTGNLSSWLQLPANQNRIQYKGSIMAELPFFKVTLNPVIEGNRFRCDYLLPMEGEDLSRGPSSLSIYRDASLEEIQIVSELPVESNESKIKRELQWKGQHEDIFLAYGLHY